jgi:hypothetical protein
MVMMPMDDGSVPPPPEREPDVTISAAPESSAAVAAAPIEGATDASSSRYMDFPSIRIIDLATTELSINDRKILEAAMEEMFDDPSLLYAITSVLPVLRQDEGAGGSAPPAAPEAAVEVLREPTAGIESVVIKPLLTPARESKDAPLLQPVEAAVDVPTHSVVGAVEGVAGEVGPSLSQPAAAIAEDIPVPSQPAAAPQEHNTPEGMIRAAFPQERDALEGVTRSASPKIQEAEENSDSALLQGIGIGEGQVLELARVP